MSLLQITDLSALRGTRLFENLSLTLHPGDRLGLVAANGAGKSTLLACLAGDEAPASGKITRARGLRVAMVAQDVPASATQMTLHQLVLSALPPEQADYESWRVDVVLDALAVPEPFQHRNLAELSGGWQRTALLAAAWVTEPDVLLLDEPTNHLDLHRIGLLQAWLRQLPREVAVIVTSHDRAFLDAVTSRTLFLRPDASRVFALPYSAACAALDQADGADARRFDNDLRRADQLRRQAAKLKNIGINSGSDLLVTKTRQLTERADRIEDAARPAHRDAGAGDIRLANSGSHARALVTLDDTLIATPDGRALFATGKRWVRPGDRIAILGPNGTGKSRLIARLHAAIAGGDAAIRATPSLVEGYCDQALSHLPDGATPMQVTAGAHDIGDQRARAALAGAGIGIDLQSGPIRQLSGGQKARLAMLVLRLAQPNFYLLDEPTNHLDIAGQEALEAELVAHDVAAVLVSHDRSFLRAVCNRFWQIDGGRLQEVDSPEPFFDRELQRV